MPETPPIVLSIAGFDPSSGAGITADIKTIAAHGCYGVSAITALTVQSTLGVRRVVPTSPKLLCETLEELRRDVKIAAVHIGMLGSGAIASAVAAFLKNRKQKNVVLDPILVSSSGSKLLDRQGIKVLTGQLLRLADVVTPNVDEATALTGQKARNEGEMRLAAERLHLLGARSVVVTGGHLSFAVDLLSVRGHAVQVFSSERLKSPNTHGTGCAFSTAIACQLALGRDLPTALLLAKAYVFKAIENGYAIGKGTSPVNHVFGREPQGGSA